MPTDPALERRALALFQDALDQPEADRVVWISTQCASDTPLHIRVTAMLHAHRLAALRTGGAALDAADEALPDAIGPYAITEVIGRGGMGTVYRAERMAGDFQRTVAIKRIKPGLLSDKLIERFERERQTLAHLEHAHIARLYDGGAMPDGAPFLVMEYVDGDPILEWTDAHAAPLDARLALFADACAAVAHAHRNLVIHRDITPSNVLVTHDGVVKLIDFGIAHPATASEQADAERPSRSLASLSLTPGYAAPERVKGVEATTLADIFSLGKLLDALVGKEDDAELAAIVARATRERPEDRYPTVDALRADIDARRHDLPVAALPPKRLYLTGKFVRRHRLGVAAGVVAVVVLLAALGGTVWALGRTQVARAEAEHRFDETRGIAKALLFDVYDEVSKVSGATGARVKLATTGLAYLDALASDTRAPRDVRIETGLGYLRLTQVTGDGQGAQLGKYQDANALLAKSEEILKPLYGSTPGDPTVAKAYAELLVEQASVNIYNNQRIELAREQARRAQALLAPLKPSDPATVRAYALAMQAEGDSYLWTGDFPPAQVIHEKVENYLSRLPAALQREPGIMGVRSSNLRLLGESLHKQKKVAETRAVLDRGVGIARTLALTDPANPDLRRRLAVALRYAGIVHRTNMRDPEALAAIKESVEISRELLARDPRDAGALRLFAATSEVYAQVLGDAGRYAESYEVGAEVYAAQKKLVTLAGNTPGAIRSLATSTSTRGGNHYNGGDYISACHWWREALDLFVALERRGELSEADRKKGVPELRKFLRLGCENGSPRKLDGGETP